MILQGKTALSSLLILCMCNFVHAADIDKDAEAAMKDYTELLIAGKTHEAVGKYWDYDSLLSGTFGVRYHQLSKDDKKRLQDIQSEITTFSLDVPDVKKIFSDSKISTIRSKVDGPEYVLVDVQLSNEQIRFNKTSIFLMHKKEGKWKIIDTILEGQSLSVKMAMVFVYANEALRISKPLIEVFRAFADDLRKQVNSK